MGFNQQFNGSGLEPRIITGDADGDGFLDLIEFDEAGNDELYFGASTGTFTRVVGSSMLTPGVRSGVLTSVVGGSHLDVVLSIRGGGLNIMYGVTNGSVPTPGYRSLVGVPTGTDLSQVIAPLLRGAGGLPTVVLAAGDGSSLYAFDVNNSNIDDYGRTTVVDPQRIVSAVAAGEFTGEGNLDLVVATRPGTGSFGLPAQLHVLRGDGDGGLQVVDGGVPGQHGQIDGRALAVGDLNGDGVDDLVIADTASNIVWVVRSAGPGCPLFP